MLTLTARKLDIAALLAGALLPLSFAPFGWWPIAIVCLALFRYIVQVGSMRRLLGRAILFGLGYFGVGVSWVYVSISLFGNASPPLAAVITVLLIIALSGYIVLTAYLVRKFHTDSQLLRVALLPSLWVAVEWLRGWLFTGFSWLDIGYAFVDTPLSAYAPFVGVLGVSYLAVLSAAGFYLLTDRKASIRGRLTVASTLAAIWFAPTLTTLPVLTSPHGESIQVALIQGNVPQHRKWQNETREQTLEMYRQLTNQHWDKQLIVWPETAIPAFEDQVFNYLEALHAAAQASDTIVMLGMPVRQSHGSQYFNALGVLGNADRGADTLYQKRHLVPFGEYLPLRFLLGPLLDFLVIPMSNFSPGEDVKPVVTAGRYQAGAFICFEIAFGEAVRKAMPQADYLVNISNDAWFGNSLAAHQHLQMARMRALENGRYVLRSTNTGISAIIGTDGELQGVLPQFKRRVLAGSIQAMRGETVYTRYGDYLILGFVLLAAIGRYLRK